MKAHFVTDTATLCIFDPVALRHRLSDDADWWSVPSEELREVNSGTVGFVGLGSDGQYDVEVVPKIAEPGISFLLSSPGGRVFIGAGEEVSSDGLEPECVRGGLFVDLPAGTYIVNVVRHKPRRIRIAFHSTTSWCMNAFSEPLRLT
jgi:hypothetical protein